MKKILILMWLCAVFPLSAQFVSLWDAVPENVRNKNSYQRYEWFYRPRTDAQGKYPHELVNRLIEAEEKKIQLSKRFDKNEVSSTWTNIGPSGIDMSSSFISYWGTVSGRSRGLAVHPTNVNTVYAGAAAGGIWKTTDGGSTWTDISGIFSRLTFGAIAIDPNSTNTVFAGTGESRWLFNNVTYEGNGLYKTTDGGSSWTRITNGFGSSTQFSDIVVNPGNSNVVLAALGSGNWNYGNQSNEGIWRSTDGGATWSRTLNVQDGFDVAFHPTNANLAYAAVGNKESTSGFYRSTNGGSTWVQSNTGLPSATSIGRMQFDISISNPDILYAIIYSNTADFSGHQTAAYKSTNGGVNWSQISSGVNIAGSYNGSSVNDQGSYDLCVAVHPTDPDIALFGNVEVSRTTNGSTVAFVRNPSGAYLGTTAWDSYAHVDIHKIVFAPSNGNYVYLACDGGIYKSTKAGASFSSVNNNINTIQFYRLASHPTNASILFGGAQDNGNFSTSNKGASNWVFETTGDGMECFVDHTDPNFVFMSTQSGSLMRSTDAGVTWNDVYSLSTNTAWVAPYWQHPTQANKIYAALNQRIYRSNSRGSAISWSALSSAFTSNRITSVGHSSVNVNKLAAVASYYTASPEVHVSTDEGVSWSSVTSKVTDDGFSGNAIQRVVLDPVNENTLYLCRASYFSGQVIKSTDFGQNWTDASGSLLNALPAVPVNDLFIDPANSNHLYAASDLGVYWSSDGGTNWSRLSSGMPIVPVMDFSFYNYSGTRYLRAATHGRGVYELQIDTPLPVELTSFTAETALRGVQLRWSTATEINNFGFDIERSTDGSLFSKIGFVSGNGNSNATKHYSFIDNNASGFITYRLKQIDNDGAFSYTKTVQISALSITDYEVYQNYPNPFNAQTMISFKVPEESDVQVNIINPLGQVVESLSKRTFEAGVHQLMWDAGTEASGVYFAVISLRSVSGKAGMNKTLKLIVSK